MHGIIVERMSCLVHGLHYLHSVWCVFQGWDVGTLGNTLQKQVGCFNHRVVALVADKLEGQWLLEVCFDVED